MAKKYAYFPGNVSRGSAAEVEDTMIPLCRSLGINLVELKGATSCGAGIIKQANKMVQLTLNARTFALAEELGLDIITPCATSKGTLHDDLVLLRDDAELRENVNKTLFSTTGLKFEGNVEVFHLLHILIDEVGVEKIQDSVVNELGLSVAGYYGSNMQKIGACGNDDPWAPAYFETLIEALGGKAINYDSRTQSVGYPSLLTQEKVAMKMTANVLSDAKQEGAQLMASACTLSHSCLDTYQVLSSKVSGKDTNLPVIHLTELVAYALGHYVDRFALLRTRAMLIGA